MRSSVTSPPTLIWSLPRPPITRVATPNGVLNTKNSSSPSSHTSDADTDGGGVGGKGFGGFSTRNTPPSGATIVP